MKTVPIGYLVTTTLAVWCTFLALAPCAGRSSWAP
jgi:hypothetical protein